VPLADWIDSLAAGALVAGPALDADAYGRLAATRPDLLLAPPGSRAGTAAAAGRAALLRAAAGHADDPATLVPDYLRPSYADEKVPAAAP
jgi:tRNA A37 threonylcarbamoyladenosine modification protein TsaB